MAGMPVVDIFDGGIVFQPGILKPAGQRFIFAPGPLLVDQQAEPFFKTELAHFRILGLPVERFGHPGEFHGGKFLNRGLH